MIYVEFTFSFFRASCDLGGMIVLSPGFWSLCAICGILKEFFRDVLSRLADEYHVQLRYLLPGEIGSCASSMCIVLNSLKCTSTIWQRCDQGQYSHDAVTVHVLEDNGSDIFTFPLF